MGSEGVAVIEYEDGERDMVDMKIEKFRTFSDEDDRGDDTADGDGDVNDFSLIVPGKWIEILWKHANIYFPCKIISWTPLRAKKSRLNKKSKKRAFNDVAAKKSTKTKIISTQVKTQLSNNQKGVVVST
jgi:hypothetical protein